MIRIFSHNIIYKGAVFKHSIIHIDGEKIKIEPFKEEIAGTIFYNGTVVIGKYRENPFGVEKPCSIAEIMSILNKITENCDFFKIFSINAQN